MLSRLTLPALGLYAASIPMPTNVVLPESLRIAIYNTRPYVVVMLLALILFERYMRLRSRRVFPQSVEGKVFVLSLAFPAYYLLTSVAKGTFVAPVAGLYFSWSLFAFLLAPMLIRSIRDLRSILLVLVLANGAVLIHGIAMRLVDPSEYSGPPGGFAYGYTSPDYFAQVAMVLMAGLAMISLAREADGLKWSRAGRIALFFAFLSTAWFVGALAARSVVAFLVTGAAAYLILRRGQNVWAVLSLLVAGALALTLALFYPQQESVDTYSSGRLSIWSEAGKLISEDGEPLLAFLAGPTQTIPQSFGAVYDDLAPSKNFEKTHIDNAYIELVLEGGIIGLLLFLLPYGTVTRSAIGSLSRPHQNQKLTAGALALLMGLACFGLTSTAVPTFNSPVGFLFSFVSFLPAGVVRLSRADQELSHSEPQFDRFRTRHPAPESGL